LKNNVPVGFCFLLQALPTEANIPLIGVRPSESGKGFGKQLLKHTITSCLRGVMAEKITVVAINATMDTDNIQAIKMYRRMGFKEKYNYGHVYLPRSKAEKMKPGQWCS
jgi:ribosomal protein S18 acetylase RimI-like enzyme